MTQEGLAKVEGFKWVVQIRFWFYADEIKVFREILYTIKRQNFLVGTSKEIGLLVNTDKTKYVLYPEIRMYENVTTLRQVINTSNE